MRNMPHATRNFVSRSHSFARSLLCLRPDGHVTVRVDIQREGLRNEVMLCSQVPLVPIHSNTAIP